MSVCLCDSQSIQQLRFSFILNETFSKSDSHYFFFWIHNSFSFIHFISVRHFVTTSLMLKQLCEYAFHLHLFIVSSESLNAES